MAIYGVPQPAQLPLPVSQVIGKLTAVTQQAAPFVSLPVQGKIQATEEIRPSKVFALAVPVTKPSVFMPLQGKVQETAVAVENVSRIINNPKLVVQLPAVMVRQGIVQFIEEFKPSSIVKPPIPLQAQQQPPQVYQAVQGKVQSDEVFKASKSVLASITTPAPVVFVATQGKIQEIEVFKASSIVKVPTPLQAQQVALNIYQAFKGFVQSVEPDGISRPIKLPVQPKTWQLVPGAHAIAQGADGASTSAVDTTGAALLIASVASYVSQTEPVLTDSASNTWVPLSDSSNTGENRLRLWYCIRPVTSVSHTATVTQTGSFTAICFAAFSNTLGSARFDTESGSASSGVTSIQPGSVTPQVSGELVVQGWSGAGGTSLPLSIDSSLEILDSVGYQVGVNFGDALAWLSYEAVASINPQWSWPTAGSAIARLALFIAASPSPFVALPVQGKVQDVDEPGVSRIVQQPKPAPPAPAVFTALRGKIQEIEQLVPSRSVKVPTPLQVQQAAPFVFVPLKGIERDVEGVKQSRLVLVPIPLRAPFRLTPFVGIVQDVEVFSVSKIVKPASAVVQLAAPFVPLPRQGIVQDIETRELRQSRSGVVTPDVIPPVLVQNMYPLMRRRRRT